jgi:hypothetical protein
MHRRTRGLLLMLLALLATACLFEFLRLKSPVANVSAVDVSGSIGVYWDAGCSNRTSSIDWGVLSVGESKSVVVYVGNEGNETVFLTMKTSNFLPAGASDYLSPTFNCTGHKIKVGDVLEVTISLFVSPTTNGNLTLSFDMVFEGNKYVVGDLNGDGVINLQDLRIFVSAYNKASGDTGWNPDADLNEDGRVDLSDLRIMASIIAVRYNQP